MNNHAHPRSYDDQRPRRRKGYLTLEEAERYCGVNRLELALAVRLRLLKAAPNPHSRPGLALISKASLDRLINPKKKSNKRRGVVAADQGDDELIEL